MMFLMNGILGVKSKEEHKEYRTQNLKKNTLADYIESLVAIEEAMEPYKEQKRDLKKEYLEKSNGLLKKIFLYLFVLFVYSKTI